MFRPGEAIAVRALDPSGRPLIGLPATIVEDGPDLIAAYLAVGAPVLWPAGAELGGPRGRSIIRWDGKYRESHGSAVSFWSSTGRVKDTRFTFSGHPSGYSEAGM